MPIFQFKLNWINENNTVPQLHWPLIQCSEVTCGLVAAIVDHVALEVSLV